MIPHHQNISASQEEKMVALSPDQVKYFKELCAQVKANQMSMNQAYKNATMGYSYMSEDGTEKTKGEFQGSFNLWVQNAVEQGWVGQAAAVMGGLQQKFTPEGIEQAQLDAQNAQDYKNPRRGLYIGIGIAVVATLAYVYFKNKEND